MYSFLVCATILKSLRPYVKKHVLNTLSSHDFLFMNTLFIAIVVFLFFIYKCFSDKKIVNKTFDNIKKLTWVQLTFFFLLATITVSSTIVFLEFDKNYNTPLVNSMITKFISTLVIMFVSIFVFKETYSTYQITGVILTVVGILMTTNQNPFAISK
jgi:drug/metabolite transporter (DMT)-like permease